MRLVRMGELCEQLGIPRRTFNDWVNRDPDLAIEKPSRHGKVYWIKLDKLSERFGFDLVEVYGLMGTRWVRAADLAKVTGISRRTICNWCRGRPNFGKRIGRNYWVDLKQFGASDEQIEKLLGELGQLRRARK